MSKKTRANTPIPATADKEDRWRARDALSTLTRADEIRRDKALMRDVKAEAKAQIKTVGRVLTPNKRKTTP